MLGPRELRCLLIAAMAVVWLGGCVRQPAPPPAAPPAAVQEDRPAAEPAEPDDPDAEEADDEAEDRPAARAARDTTDGPKPYDEVITEDAETRHGLFITHRIDNKLYFEIPREELDTDMLLLRRAVLGSGGNSTRVVRWEEDGKRVLLRSVTYDAVADPAEPIHRAVASVTYGPILASFDIETFGPDSAAVIEVTRLYTTDVPEFVAVTSLARDRTFIEQVVSFPDNIEVVATQTGMERPQGAPTSVPPQSRSVRLNWSMIRLPREPMMPRLWDPRVGTISVSLIDYGLAEHRAPERRYVRRFRLEKRNPRAEVSEPVEPIVFYIDPGTPDWLVPWVKRGVEEWLPAFEGAGFRNAIVAREAPTPEEDPDWSMFDARHSIIYWRASTVQNATGGQQVDPRSGEIIKAEVNMFHNVMNLLRNWYFVQVSPLDERARSLPLPDEVMGRLVQYVVAHEVGHAIGYPHNFKASAMYPADSLRSADFLERMGGHVATVMDYSRFNYVAQPEDNVPVELLVPSVGPYDHFAVMWSHKPIPEATTPDAERPTLDRWARMQDTIPWFRFTTADATNDPHGVTEAVGNDDAVKSSALALRNLERVMDNLLPAAERPGEDYQLLQELYGNVVAQWGRYMGHVAAVIGGAYTQERTGTGTRFEPVSRAEQEQAMRFLVDNAFQPPAYLLDAEVLRRIESEGVIDRIRAAQVRVLNTLLADARLNRMIEYEAFDANNGNPIEAYTVADLMADLRGAIWDGLTDPQPRTDVYRRNLQRAHLEAIDRTLNPPIVVPAPGPPQQQQQQIRSRFGSDVQPILRGELVELSRVIVAATPRAGDAMTRLHLEAVQFEIGRILNPGAHPPLAARDATTASDQGAIFDWWCAVDDPAGPWPDPLGPDTAGGVRFDWH